MRGCVLALILVLSACGEQALLPSPPDSPGALHNAFVEEFLRSYDGHDEVATAIAAFSRVWPEVEVEPDDVRLYAREARQLIEYGYLTDHDRLARELVRRGVLRRAEVSGFLDWLVDPTRPATFSGWEVAVDVRSHSAALWAGKQELADDQEVIVADTIGALIGLGLAGPVGSILGGGLVSLLTSMEQDAQEEAAEFWETWTGPLPPKR